MDLLPKDHKEFSTKEYWQDFFIKQKSQHFEWYGDYNSLNEVLDRYIKIKDRILIIGCGNSKLSVDLYDVGLSNSVSIDSNPLVIKQMKENYCKDRPNLVFEHMDVFELSYDNDSFAVVLDKGTLDALFVDESSDNVGKIEKMFSQIERVLRYGGRYICISLLQEHILNKALDWFLDKGWLVRIHRCMKAETRHDDSITFPVFLLILTKMKQIANSSMILEIIYDGQNAPQRCSSKQEAIDYVKSAQHYSFLKYYLHKKKVIGEDICLELYCSQSGQVKYRMFVVDSKDASFSKFAIFIVPQGRETDWLFSTPEGRRELAMNAKFERLIVVHLLQNNVYTDLDEVKKEISAKILELAPSELKSQVPILSLGEDIGKREIKCSSKSKTSGDYVVEDVTLDNNSIFRRLIFLNNPYLIQSEVKLTKVQKKKGGCKMDIDFDYLACDHHVTMIYGLAFLQSKMLSPKILQIGLGGGTLAMYLYKHFPEAVIEAVELDSEIVNVAKKWFQLGTDDRLKVYVKDGIEFFKEVVQKGQKYDTVILDVDSKDPSLGINSPPVEFLEEPVLDLLTQVVSDSGVVILNLACRNLELRKDTLAKLKSVFQYIFSRKIPNEVNEVLFCLKDGIPEDILKKAKDQFENLVSFLEKGSKHNDVFDTTDIMSSLNEIT
ncbi:eEF1A lysine and N-terminal methyltransferase-like [Uloborus diversus]|uniref:eEF1A lysine and N-terminal methyltransferase-like n=1 Tax=Uloborus diversus TaxID=327109 RepID=UPI0024098326|nr:eEF1A lysine and N-terminal methyltransferase-like [Uloborus diversus]XP_054717728.1 eEF1A lysine and N-terminal methyltransferase-like [Uloborus diversus]XP_054717729.1 eEF1A lysine and N-terminal methyltransferase-like [Uloborus diversus]